MILELLDLGVYEYDATVYVPFETALLICAICADSNYVDITYITTTTTHPY